MLRKKSMYLVSFILILCSVILLIPQLSCSKGGVVKGGALTFIVAGTELSNIGWVANGIDPGGLIYLSPCIESLVYIGAESALVPHLAESWDVSPDGKTTTFKLRQNVKFHDGTAFDANAVKYNWDLHIKNKRSSFAQVKSIDVVDANTITVNFNIAQPLWVRQLSSSGVGFMISPTAHKQNGDDYMRWNPVGTGPFKFVSCQRDSSIIFEKFDEYWMEGKPYIDRLEFRIIKEAAIGTASFLAGEADIIKTYSTTEINNITSQLPDTKVNKGGGLLYAWFPDSSHSTSPFSNITVRKAVTYAIDRAAIAKAIGEGFMTPTDQFTSSEHPAYNPNVIGYPYNVAKARQLLAEAGYSSGFSCTVLHSGSTVTNDLATAISGYLKAVGIDATVPASSSTTHTGWQEGGWTNGLLYIPITGDLGSEPWVSLVKYFGDTRYRAVSTAYPKSIGSIMGLLPNEPSDQLRKELMQRAQQIFIDEDCTFIPMVTMPDIVLYSSKVNGFDLCKYSTGHWNPWDVWLTKS